MKTLAIIGAGHLGQQIANYAITDNHYQKVVFFDDFISEKQVNGYLVLGSVKEVINKFDENTFDELIIGIGYKHLDKRKKLFELFNNLIPFGTIIHSTTWVERSAIVEPGCIIYPKCEIDQHSIIKTNTILNIGCSIAHNSIVGKHSFLSPRVAIAGFVNVGDECILGINSTIIDNINVMFKTQIGAGTVVIKNIDKSGVYVGNPAKFIRK